MIDNKKAKFVIDFMEILKLTDDFFGQPFILQEWQRDLITNVYGTMSPDNPSIRQYNYAYLEVPKKNAKTTMVAGLAVMHLTTDPDEGQIYCCAADRAQAMLVYKAAVSMIEQEPELKEIMKITDSKKEIKNKITNTVLKVLSAEAYTKHGLGISPAA